MATAFHGTPLTLEAALAAPMTERKGWQDEVAPTYIGLFLLAVYYDQLAVQTLSVAGLGWSLLGALLGGLAGFALIYLASALWGLRARQPIAVVATSTFGASGALWVPGLVIGLAQLVWFAVAIYTAARIALGGLVAGRLLDARYMLPMNAAGFRLESPLFLVVTFTWAVSSAGIGIWLVRLVAALLRAYAVFPALVLGGAMIWALPGLKGFHTLGVDPLTGVAVQAGGPLACVTMMQLVLGYFATAGVSAADWGAVSRDARDVRLGGLVGIALAAPILAALPLVTIAGAIGRAQGAEAFTAADFVYHEVLQNAIGGPLGCAMLLVLGLALLGPTCFCPFVYSHRFGALWPRLPRWAWSLIGALVAWPLVAFGVPARLGLVFTGLGAAMAPVAGALTADFQRSRGVWPGPRRGVNLAGLFAWLVGCVVGLIPLAGAILGRPALERFQPAALYAFVAAFLVYALLARLGLEPPALAFAGTAPASEASVAPVSTELPAADVHANEAAASDNAQPEGPSGAGAG